MATDLIPAIWRGPFDGETLYGRTLNRGETYPVTERDLQSAHWERVKAAKSAKPTDSGSDS